MYQIIMKAVFIPKQKSFTPYQHGQLGPAETPLITDRTQTVCSLSLMCLWHESYENIIIIYICLSFIFIQQTFLHKFDLLT